MEIKTLIENHPRLFHMAEPETWKSIKKHGLLSTKALLDKCGITGVDRFNIESKRRPESVVITSAKFGRITIRDQKPISDSALGKCLSDFTAQKWYEILNGKVFFWLSEERLRRLLRARAYRNKKHCVLTVETKKLVENYSSKIHLSPINSGSTVFKPQPRGAKTFLPIQMYPYQDWFQKRGGKDPIAELTIEYQILDISDHALEVRHIKGDRVIERVWKRPNS